MTRCPPRGTGRPFTVALCARCRASTDQILLEYARATVRRCDHGVLVHTECLLGKLACTTRGSAAGPVLMLQPCTVDRRAVGPALWIGPITSHSDVVQVCGWIETGRWCLEHLPRHLHLMSRTGQTAITN
jgi:hypothetical protein